jgi:phosphoglycolate phosphatase-like HAD superfamily hydrolase
VRPLVVGFDLDMTLIDTRPGIAAVWDALSAETGVPIDSAAAVSRLGPPLDDELAVWFAEGDRAAAGDRFRALYPSLAVTTVPVLAGAREAMAAVRRHGGTVVVVTGKYEPNARRHVEHLALDVDHVTGLVVGAGKAEALLREGASLLVGDHVHDVEGARAAGITSVSVLTGGCTEEELVEAGTDVVLADLTDFPAWLDAFVAAQESLGV